MEEVSEKVSAQTVVKTEYRKVRVRYGKTGFARFISQLDMYKLFLPAFRRADISARYTAGFNPQLYLAFAFPLPTGVSGECEYLDFLCETGTLTDAEITQRLSASLPQGFAVYESYTPVRSEKDVSFARYDVCADDVTLPLWRDFLAQDSVIITKRGKKNGVKTDVEVEIIPHARMFGNLLQLPAGVSFTLNPALVCGAFERFAGVAVPSVRRVALFCDDGTLFS
ncbi:hypothetical protein FACS1894120_2350 [Clostridia bacterium]|nr:hypothetical protein FACS1894120_2350 [Clostridia bacterium]